MSNNSLRIDAAPSPPWNLKFDLFPTKAVKTFDEWIGTEQGRAIYRYFKHFTFRLAHAGFKHYSARAICQRIRWHYDVEKRPLVAGESDYKVNNNYTPYLARKFMDENPQFEGFFELRELKSK